MFNALSQLAQAFAQGDEASQRRAFKISKALNIGQAIMQTASAVTGALGETSLFPGERFIKAAAAGAVGIAQIQTIRKNRVCWRVEQHNAAQCYGRGRYERNAAYSLYQSKCRHTIESLQG